MNALEMCLAARRAWDRSQPQTFLELDGLLDERHDADTNLPQGVPVPLVEQPSSSCHLVVEDAALSRRSRRFDSGQERCPSPVGGDRDAARPATPDATGKAPS